MGGRTYLPADEPADRQLDPQKDGWAHRLMEEPMDERPTTDDYIEGDDYKVAPYSLISL